MKTWFGHEMLECKCGWCTPDKAEFEDHLKKFNHERLNTVKKVVKKDEPKEENNDGVQD